MRPLLEMMRPLYSSIYLMIVTSLWMFLSPSDILELQPRMFFYMVGTVFSHICCRLIVAQMSSTRCEAFNWTLFPVTALALVRLNTLTLILNDNHCDIILITLSNANLLLCRYR